MGMPSLAAAVAALALLAGPQVAPVAESTHRVDIVEVNAFYDGEGRLVFNQAIFWVWMNDGHRVAAWSLKPAATEPRRTPGGKWVVYFEDSGHTYTVFADSFRRTFTQDDPELIDREFLPAEHRPNFIEDSRSAQHATNARNQSNTRISRLRRPAGDDAATQR